MNPWKNIWAMHDTSWFGHLLPLVPGVETYCDRALLLPAKKVVIHRNGAGSELIDEYLEYLDGVRIGPGSRNVARVDGKDLYEGILNDPDLLHELHHDMRHGAQVQFFCTTERAEEFIRLSMLERSQVHSSPLEISNQLNDKIRLREIGKQLNLERMFAEHEIVTNKESALVAIRRFLDRPESEVEFVILRRGDRAGGDATYRLDRDDENLVGRVEWFFEIHGKDEQGRPNKILVEDGFDHSACSTQLIFGQSRRPRFMGPTCQDLEKGGAFFGRHIGNTMAFKEGPGNPHPNIKNEDRIHLEEISRQFGEWAHDRINVEGLRGTIGFDFLKRTRDGRIFMTECNARQTASTYPLAVSHQLRGRGRKSWGIAMLNSVPTTARSFGELKKKLGRYLFTGENGILPFNLRLMRLPEPRVGIIAIANDIDWARLMTMEINRWRILC